MGALDTTNDGDNAHLRYQGLGSRNTINDQRVVHRRYGAYGLEWADERALNSQEGTDDLATDHRFTGQKADGTGLMYYNARYYDPQLGMFISPDSIVPDPTTVLGVNPKRRELLDLTKR